MKAIQTATMTLKRKENDLEVLAAVVNVSLVHWKYNLNKKNDCYNYCMCKKGLTTGI